MKNPFSADSVVSPCYGALFELITEGDFFVQDVMVIGDTLKFYDMFVYYPANLFKDAETVYE